MKRFLTILLAAVLLALPALAQAEISIAATSYPLYDMARRIGGENVSVSYIPDAQVPQGAQILLTVADEAEAPEGCVLIRAIDDVVEPIEGDDSVLTIAINNALVASRLTEQLQLMDDAAGYGEALSAYMDALFALDAQLRDALRATLNEGITVSCGDGGSMAYFAQEYREYGVKYDQDAPDALVLNSYEHPDAADLQTPYIELMRRNLEIIQG